MRNAPPGRLAPWQRLVCQRHRACIVTKRPIAAGPSPRATCPIHFFLHICLAMPSTILQPQAVPLLIVFQAAASKLQLMQQRNISSCAVTVKELTHTSQPHRCQPEQSLQAATGSTAIACNITWNGSDYEKVDIATLDAHAALQALLCQA